MAGAGMPPGSQDAPDEERVALLQDARAYLERPGLREAYRQFVRTAADLAKAGMVFEVVTRPDAGGTPRQQPRHLTVTTRPEHGLGEDESTVLLMGVGFWEFLPGRFQGSERVMDATRLAMDVGTFRFVENTPSGDAEIVGYENGRPLAQYMRIDISGEGLEKSIAVSNVALGGAFVAAYRNYLEVMSERPYRSLHPYRQLGTPAAASGPPPRVLAGRIAPRLAAPFTAAAASHAAGPGAGRVTGPAASAALDAPALPAAAAMARPRRRGGMRWAWLGIVPALAGAWFLVNLALPQQEAPDAPAGRVPPSAAPSSGGPSSSGPSSAAPARAYAPPAATAPSASAGPSSTAAAPAELPPLPTVDLAPPLPLPPPAAPEPTAATAPPAPTASPDIAISGRVARVRVDSNVRSAPSSGASVVRTVAAGTVLRIAREEFGWQHVFLLNGTELGWIYGTLLE